MNEEQQMEWEVLESIYSVDEDFKRISNNRLQYKVGVGTDKSFIVEIEWPDDYPTTSADINMDVFYNSSISTNVRNAIRSRLLEVAKENEGMASSFAIIEFAKENIDSLTAHWELAMADAIGEVQLDDEKRKEPMTKAAKRRMWGRNEGIGSERGSNWVDIIKHLSQTRDN